MQKFKYFLLNEEKSYLGHKVGDVLTSMHDLQNDLEDMGSRQLSRIAENIVNEIRKILHGRWNPKHFKSLKELQKVGVAIQKTIDDKGDLKSILPSATKYLEELSGKLGVKLNDLDAPEDDLASMMQQDPNAQQDPNMEDPNMQQDPNMQPQDPNMQQDPNAQPQDPNMMQDPNAQPQDPNMMQDPNMPAL